LNIGRRGLGNIATKFKKVIICFETGKCDVKRRLLRRAGIFFSDNKHHFYISETTFRHSLKQNHNYINDENNANKAHLQLLYVCIAYYNKFINQNLPITEDSTIEFIYSALLNNADAILLLFVEVKLLYYLFKYNRYLGYADYKLDQQINMKFTPQIILLSKSSEKEKQHLQKQIDNSNVLISIDLPFIKDKGKEVNKNGREVKKLKY
jgi:hypothetical protein